MTYGDGVGSIDVTASIAFHKQHGRLATMTATQPPGRFGRRSVVLRAFLGLGHSRGDPRAARGLARFRKCECDQHGHARRRLVADEAD